MEVDDPDTGTGTGTDLRPDSIPPHQPDANAAPAPELQEKKVSIVNTSCDVMSYHVMSCHVDVMQCVSLYATT